MTNQIALIYDFVSQLLPKLKLGTPASVPVTRVKAVQALKFPPETSTLVSVTFRGIKRDHTISVGFVKIIPETISGRGGIVEFITVRQDHTIHVDFVSDIIVSEPYAIEMDSLMELSLVIDTGVPSFNEVNPEFDCPMSLEVVVRGPGEHDIEFNEPMSLLVIREDIVLPILDFNSNSSIALMLHLTEVHISASVFSNRWKKEMLSTYSDVGDVGGDYRIALMKPSFNFDPDNHAFFVDQVDSFEIVRESEYVSGIPIEFDNFSSDGILSFKDLTLPVAKGGSYGPIGHLVIYDYDTHVRGLIVVCLPFPENVTVDDSTIKLSDLSFQIV